MWICPIKRKCILRLKIISNGCLGAPLSPPLPKHGTILKSRSNPRYHTRTFSNIIGVGLLCFYSLSFSSCILCDSCRTYTSLPCVVMHLWLICKLVLSPVLVLSKAGGHCLIPPLLDFIPFEWVNSNLNVGSRGLSAMVFYLTYHFLTPACSGFPCNISLFTDHKVWECVAVSGAGLTNSTALSVALTRTNNWVAND